DRVELVLGPLETALLPRGAFDVVFCDAVIHHLLPDLDRVVRRLIELGRPGALFMLNEPTSFSAALRRVRRLIPLRSYATPDERPLEDADCAVLRAYLQLECKRFGLLGRLDRLLLRRGYDYEGSSALRRGMSNLLALVDMVLLELPGVRDLGSTAVFYGRP